MHELDTLAPDQRAVLELVLRQGRSYGELSELLGIPERDVRARADAGLRALAGEAAAGVDTGRIADWLLGQQPEAEADRTRRRGAQRRDRRWAASAAERLREVGACSPVPDVSGGAGRACASSAAAARRASSARPRPCASRRPRRTPVPRSSRLGGAILIGVLAVLVGGLIAFVVLRCARRRAAGR